MSEKNTLKCNIQTPFFCNYVFVPDCYWPNKLITDNKTKLTTAYVAEYLHVYYINSYPDGTKRRKLLPPV